MNVPLPELPRGVLRPMAWAYGVAVARRNRRFDAGEGVRRAARPVLSIGNIVAGGSGKTPITAWLARRLLAEGVRPMIALRGYGAKTPERADEAMEYAELLPGVPIAAGPDRAAVIERTLADGAVADVVLLDDGFQHRRLHRDLDLVLVDAGRACLDAVDAKLLPVGWLREPPEALRRASAVIVTHAPGDGVAGADGEVLESEQDAVGDFPQSGRASEAALELGQAIERFHGKPPLAWFRHRWTGIDVHEPGASGGARGETVGHLRGLHVATVLGVAQPRRVREMVERAGAIVELDLPMRDHQRYDAAMLRGIVSRISASARSATPIDAIVTTRKDWTKLAAFAALLPCPVLVPRLDVAPIAGGDAVVELALRSVCRAVR
jgi:tetraacyldisaccharide 4'-kinase